MAKHFRDDIAPKVAADVQVYKQFVENESFKRSVSDLIYAITGPGTAGNGHVQP